MSPATVQRRNHSAFGSRRERAVKERLEAEGWVVFRCAASKPCDLIALRAHPRVVKAPTGPGQLLSMDNLTGTKWLVEVKGTQRSPWVAWGPAERAELRETARRAGAVPLLAWWPPHGELQWIGEAEWPG